MANKLLKNKIGLFILVTFVALLFVLSWLIFSGYLTFDRGNLLRETNMGIRNFTLIDNGFNAFMENDNPGVKVTLHDHDDNGWLVLFYDDSYSRYLLEGPVGTAYTLSFAVKTNFVGTEIMISHKQGDAKESQIDFGNVILDEADVWSYCTLTGVLTGTPATWQGLYIDLRANPSDTVLCLKDIRLTKDH